MDAESGVPIKLSALSKVLPPDAPKQMDSAPAVGGSGAVAMKAAVVKAERAMQVITGTPRGTGGDDASATIPSASGTASTATVPLKQGPREIVKRAQPAAQTVAPPVMSTTVTAPSTVPALPEKKPVISITTAGAAASNGAGKKTTTGPVIVLATQNSPVTVTLAGVAAGQDPAGNPKPAGRGYSKRK